MLSKQIYRYLLDHVLSGKVGVYRPAPDADKLWYITGLMGVLSTPVFYPPDEDTPQVKKWVPDWDGTDDGLLSDTGYRKVISSGATVVKLATADGHTVWAPDKIYKLLKDAKLYWCEKDFIYARIPEGKGVYPDNFNGVIVMPRMTEEDER